MQIGTETAITSHAILLLTWTCISSANILTDIPKNNPLNIDWYPAPSPEDGPPLSRGASRDKALLPAQIGGILGAYLFSVCIIGLFLICIGRRLREKLATPGKTDIEMVLTPFHKNFINFNQTPTTAAYPPSAAQRNFSWPSPEKDTRNPYVFPSTNQSPITPTSPKVPYVDTRIVEADREMLQRDLEDIYAHVMEQEEAKAAGVKVAEMPLPPQLQRVGPAPVGAAQRQVMSPTKTDKSRPGALNIDEAKPQSKAASRASSIISSLKSPRLGRRKSVKTMQISSPILTPMSGTFPRDSKASDEEPLSPRYYNPPPPPPIPTDQLPYNQSRNGSSIGPASPTRSIAEQINSTGRTLTSPRHHPNPSQTSVQSHGSSLRGEQPPSATSQTPLFLPPPQRKQPSPNPPSNNNSTRALPFRQFEPALASPSFTASTKTTVLERHDRNNGPMTGGLRTPWSAGAVPYSPYQPFSPMIPITPRLVTKEDRKAMKKAQPKTPTMELIQDEKDIWDSGY